MKRWVVLLAALLFFMVLSGCADTDDDMENTKHHGSETSIETFGSLSEETTEVNVTMYNRDMEKVGTATIRQVHDGTNITLDASNLPPGTHGFHIHEKGVCETPDFESAGGHFNPTNAKHGFEHPKGPHAGDLPNIVVKEDGTVRTEGIADMVTLIKGKKNSLLGNEGTALIIHAEADDYKSQPSGNAGDRIACGVIGE
ncbi:superoxide dismutase family protein [Virgibacillus salinus]|uniref:Superoxide dismutase [Cu-Zn] n=1 Tax=Virgibacillus salinus TaxID=553311 RepID=A0A1H0Y7C5_9BACI|nr:superoxide dismutase family protein [Virgibacillus salinus]SDQ10981.1 superoxide dismutase, Cu-Zn family [Virgibacillus salinus]